MQPSLDDTKIWLGNLTNIQAAVPGFVKVDRLLAKGGQGIVYAGEINGVSAAIKVYYPGQIQNRIDREVTALKMLASPAIVRLLWNGTISALNQSLPIVATNLVEGEPLNERLFKGQLGEHDLAIIAYDVLTAIDAMWQNRIVHRDLKPSNIILQSDGRACVIDLGFARHIDLATITAPGYTGGTPGYMSPEQTRAVHQLTCKSDIFALGVIILESSMGRHPTQRDQMALLATHYHMTLPPSLQSYNFANLLKRFLHPRPTVRPTPKEATQILAKYAP